MKTYSASSKDITRKWYVLDASEIPLGRMATKAASLLLGKEKPLFTRHVDCGDFVVIINAKDTVVTGDKGIQKKYYRYSGYPSGLTETSLNDQIKKEPTQIIFHAVKGMLPTNKLLSGRMKRLKVYPGPDHDHAPQKPHTLKLAAVEKKKTTKNSKEQ